ncbi:hypothetical protein SH1V18_28570 [Vallitalea longa]|uniref:beta-galactosidase n=1 Tax=Vallitalea longa TaxID=2936439 RepID=A0A9W6DGB6_9FIRM|nr:glycoside hydrolase family 2 TIM barrel-domain containing protein [Vallitalea longa]GKX30377.1 hypothetical protein SH1V18_28570 [Vallitalea longa]
MHDTNDKKINIDRYYVNSKVLSEEYDQIYMYTDVFITYTGLTIQPVKIELMMINNEDEKLITDIRCVLSGKITKVTLEVELTDIQTWTADLPKCYGFKIIVKNENDEELCEKSFKHGFRFVEAKNNMIHINGKQVCLNGVIYNNYEDDDLEALQSKYLEDIILLKRNNINTVITYDYANAHIFYDMCDEYGIYVINKPISIPDNEEQIICHEEEIKDTIYKYINYSCVIIWTIDSRVDIPIKFYKKIMLLDNTRPIYYEGNSGLKNYNPVIFTYDFIKQDDQKGESSNDHPIAGNFLCDFLIIRDNETDEIIDRGIVYNNRQLTPFSYEIKKQYESINIYPKDIIRGIFSVKNCSDILELDNYTLNWEILEDGIMIKSGELTDITIPISKRKDIYIEYNIKDILENAWYHININMVTKEESWWSKKAYNVAFAQFRIPYKAHKKRKAKELNSAKLRDRKLKYEIIGDNFEIVIDKLKGNIRSVEFDRQQYILSPVKIYIENHNEKLEMSRVKDIKVDNTKKGSIHIDVIRKCAQIKGNIITNYVIEPDGKVSIINRIRSNNKFIKVGMILEIPARFNDFSWLGKGPNDTYPEYNDGTKVGLYYYNLNNCVESGNKSDVRWSAFTDTDGEGLLIESCKDILLGIHPQMYSSYSIKKEEHNDKPIIINVKCSSKANYNIFNTSTEEEDVYAFSIKRVI